MITISIIANFHNNSQTLTFASSCAHTYLCAGKTTLLSTWSQPWYELFYSHALLIILLTWQCLSSSYDKGRCYTLRPAGPCNPIQHPRPRWVQHPSRQRWVQHPSRQRWVQHPRPRWVQHPSRHRWVQHPRPRWVQHPSRPRWVQHPCHPLFHLSPLYSPTCMQLIVYT